MVPGGPALPEEAAGPVGKATAGGIAANGVGGAATAVGGATGGVGLATTGAPGWAAASGAAAPYSLARTIGLFLADLSSSPRP